MSRADLIKHIILSDILARPAKWHWFAYHFRPYLLGKEHPFAKSIVDACLDCDAKIPGFAVQMINSLASISGKEKHEPHFEQLLQRLAELVIIRQIVTFDWKQQATFRFEPTAGASKKNPEITVNVPGKEIGFEVKAPSLLEHSRNRGSNQTQLPARAMPAEVRDQFIKSEGQVTLPRDNPVKDFLVSANGKYQQFKTQNPQFVGVLVIVWDDFIYEPISSLTHKQTGLFTPNSFAKDKDGNVLQFENVDGVVIMRHLHQLIRGSRGEPFGDFCRHALDYGREGEFPPKAFVQNPNGGEVPEVVLQCLQAHEPGPIMGAEYVPSDIVWWLGTGHPRPQAGQQESRPEKP